MLGVHFHCLSDVGMVYLYYYCLFVLEFIRFDIVISCSIKQKANTISALQ